MKKITLLILLSLIFNFGFGQTMLAQFDFETPGGYTTNEVEFTDYVFPTTGSDGRDYFLRTDGSDIRGVSFLNIQGSYYFTAQDIDGEGAVLPVTLLINNINISGYSNIEFRIHLAEDDDGVNQDWDNTGGNPDYVRINYDIDNTSSFNNLLWIGPNGTGTNNEPAIDTDFDGTGDGTTITNTFTQFTENIVGTGSLLDIEIEFNLNAGDEDIAIDNIEIWGTLAPCGAAVTWDGTVWDNANVGPNINTPAILNGPYTTNATNGSFSACSLTINTGRLTITDGYHVEVQNDVIANDELFVSSQASLVQNNDAATFIDNTTNGVILSKSKIVQNKFIYTYWSSPIVDETVENTFSTVPADKRYTFNAANFVDLLEEVGNSNPPVYLNNPGVDDIDDDGNDWEFASGIMQPGIGYAMRTNELGPAFPRQEAFSFTGEFNNGVVLVPLINNSGGLYNDWNFIGNPYPSAININQFFNVNAGIVDVVYLWDQATPLDSNASGNQPNNYSASDYAMINRLGGISGGGSGTIPNGSIASGQGFFVEALIASNITFNNSMRSIGTTDNSQFFKNPKQESASYTIPNKLWVDLTTNNDAYNQILVGYIESATSKNDGSGYDTKRVVSSGNPILLYTFIEEEDENDKFAIQGKAPSDLNENEIIDLGFKTSIDVETLYTLSIAQLQGDYLNNNTIYLKDNLLDKLHNLSDSDYEFTSEVGEFNTRFQIVFTDKALSTDDIDLNNTRLTIIELDNNHVNFKTSNSLNIKTVTIYDLLGRELYNLKGENNSETYELSNLKSTIYIAKVELSNGEIITKKAIKR